MTGNMTAETSTATVSMSAMSLLALREHSAKELRTKLLQKYEDESLVVQVIADLATRDLQSDDRFAEQFVTMRMRQGKGPVRIAHELQERGIATDLISEVISQREEDWASLAREVRVKRFGEISPDSHPAKMKQMRFLQYRGFNSAQIRAAMDQ